MKKNKIILIFIIVFFSTFISISLIKARDEFCLTSSDCGDTYCYYCERGQCLSYNRCGDGKCNCDETSSTCSKDCGTTILRITTGKIVTTTLSCQPGYTLCTQRTTPYCANLNNDRENCGACGNQCEGPIDGGYCCVNGKCTDNTGDSCSYNPPSTTPQTTPPSTPTPQTTPPSTSNPQTTPTTTLVSPYLIKIKLKGDYDKSFEYSTIYLNGEKLKEVCRDCDVNCNLQNTKQVDEIKNIDIDKYCEETGYIQIAFADSAQVDECGSVYEACINMTNTNKEYCCQIKCDEEDCQNYVAFDCDSFTCINLQDIGIKQAICDTNKCNIRIFRNVLNKQVQISILFYDKDGVIYYKTSGNINKNFIGLKTFYLNNVNDCENNNLEIKINIIDGENLILTKKVGEIKC